ncbi:sulfotransferase 1C2-like, partial [Stylophora pistillata]|uniref:sulfotransferase 1C2-like n=1 Tax=Stylophora pistillata TaxID=50429 RepID=UPI000C047CAB
KPRYIYVMRNPKDVFVSMYHHLHNMPYSVEIPTWDEAFKRLINGNIQYGLQFDHVLGWWKQRDDPNILFLTYEDRIKVRNRTEPFMDLEPQVIDLKHPPLSSNDRFSYS